jgi:threonine dehydratase
VPVENPSTIADGLRATVGERPLAEIRRLVEDITTVTDGAIVRAMRQLWEVMKIVVEPSGAVPYAALLDAPPALRGRRIGIIISGGNLDLDHLPWSAAASA